jgi:PAS domain S-box-containing protein
MLSTPFSLFCRAMVVIALGVIIASAATAANLPAVPHRILRSASEQDYPPFALVQEDGTAAGFSVDLLRAVARAVGFDVNFVVGPWHEIKQQLVDGQIDVLPLVSYSKEREMAYDFTAPYLRMHGTIFVRKGEKSIRDKSDLKDKEVIVMRGDTAHEYAVQNQLSGHLVLTNTFEEAMRLLSAGKHDAVIVQKLVGLEILKKLGISNVVNIDNVQETSLKPVDKPLEGFEQKFCIAVKDGDRALQAILNEGLAIVIANGIYAELYDKWFGPILPQPPVPLRRILIYVLLSLCPILFFVAVIGVWYLKREVARKTHSLNAEIEERKLVEKALFEKEENLRITLNSIGDAVIATDLYSNVVHLNPAASRLTGWHEGDAVGKPLAMVFRIINEYTEEMVENPATKVLKEGAVVGLANHTLLISKKGEKIPIADSGAPIKTKTGEVSGVVLVFRDQTEERAARKSLEESEERFRRTIMNAPFPIMVHSEEGEVVAINDVWTEITGYTKAVIPTIAAWSEKAYGAQKNSVIQSIARLYDLDKRVDEGEYRIRTQTGETRTWLFSSAPAGRNETGKRLVISMAMDITERTQAVQELKKLAEAVHQTSEAIVITSPDGTISYANPAFTRITGYPAEEIIGQTPRILKSGRHTQAFYRTLWDTILSGNRWSGRIVNKRKDGSVYTAECSISPVTDQQGRIVNFVWMTRDITKDLEAEKNLAHSQRIEAIGALAGGIAHDFNNLLYPIIGMSEMLLEDLPPETPHHENVKEIHNAAKRAGYLVKQILSFSRQSDQRKLPVPMQQILKEVLKLSRATIPSNIEIHSDIQNDCGLVMADPTQLHQIAMNLITNAYHAVEEAGGEISVRLTEMQLTKDDLAPRALESGKYAKLTVSDTGHGIDPSVMDKIFDPYFTTKAQGKGTGLGLSVVYGILKAHGGDIRVYSEVGKGAVFSVYLPIINRTGDVTTPQAEAIYETGTENVLLVDDEAVIARLETQMLNRLGYRVTARTSSIDALAAFKANPAGFDLVLTDMTMPNMTGIELAEKILSIRRNIPIVICTGFSEKTDAQKAKANGIRGFLMKPVVKSDMARMVRRVLDEAKALT